MGVPLAIGAAGLFGAGGSVLAGQTQANAANQAAQTQMQMYQQTRKDLSPYMNFGGGMLPNLTAMMNNPGAALPMLQNYPGYQWAFGQGLQALDQSAASRGLSLSGGQLAATQQYGQGMANQLFNQYYGQLMGGAQLGANAAAGLGTQGVGLAGQAGQATYAGGVGQAAGYAGLMNNLGGGGLLAYQMANPNAFLPQGGYSGPQPVDVTASPVTGQF
jgi:hypothetical protein